MSASGPSTYSISSSGSDDDDCSSEVVKFSGESD